MTQQKISFLAFYYVTKCLKLDKQILDNAAAVPKVTWNNLNRNGTCAHEINSLHLGDLFALA